MVRLVCSTLVIVLALAVAIPAMADPPHSFQPVPRPSPSGPHSVGPGTRPPATGAHFLQPGQRPPANRPPTIRTNGIRDLLNHPVQPTVHGPSRPGDIRDLLNKPLGPKGIRDLLKQDTKDRR